MCGISIAINTQNDPVSQEQIKGMNDKVMHRGPDDEGYFFGKNFAFGHRRLSIIDLSKAGHQPMQWKHLNIIYNGEIFNYVELREELTAAGYLFHTASDTEVILAAYEEWGIHAFERFNGMWALAIHDSNTNEIILSRDHFGIKPLYFTKIDDLFLAGSEIKQFLQLPGFKPVLNKKTAVNFLTKGLLNYSSETFFEGINELRPGTFLKYNLDTHKIEIKEWYNLDIASKKINDSFEVASATVRRLFLDSLRIRMRSDVKVGSCLSGGIDSSSIVCSVANENWANREFETITSCYENKEYDEQIFSDEVTAKTGVNSLKVYPHLNNLFDLKHLDQMIYHQDQPFSGNSSYSEFSVFRKAKERNLTVMLDGQGSDEYLCGYPEFYIARISELLRRFKIIKLYKLIKTKAQHKGISCYSEIKKLIQTFILFPTIHFIKKIRSKKYYSWLNDEWSGLAEKHEINFKNKNIRQLSIDEIKFNSIPYQLHSEDRHSMMFSIESRLPFLDHRLVEYVIGLPSDYKLKNGYTKFILRIAIAELPESVKWRKDKMGFVAPDAPWMLENNAIIRKELENVINKSTIFTDDLLERFDRFVKGELGYEPIYYRALCFSRFCDIFKVELQ